MYDAFNLIQDSFLTPTNPHPQMLPFICSYTETGLPCWDGFQLTEKKPGGERSNHAQCFQMTTEPVFPVHGARFCDRS